MSKKILSKVDAPKHLLDREHEVNDNDFIVSKTDRTGKIIYCNEIFTKMAGYPASSLIGANHNLIRHPDMPRVTFKMAWDLIKQSKEFFGYIKNLCADGSYYWVFAYVTADLDTKGNITSYTSVRRKAQKSAIETIIPLYKKLQDTERIDGMDAAGKLLDSVLHEHKKSYNEFILDLQKGASL